MASRMNAITTFNANVAKLTSDVNAMGKSASRSESWFESWATTPSSQSAWPSRAQQQRRYGHLRGLHVVAVLSLTYC